MTDLARPVVVPITEAIEAFVDLGRDGLTAIEEAEVDRILTELAADTARLLAARNQEQFCDALEAWGRDFAELAAVLLGGVVAVGADVSLVAIALLLKFQFPRLGAVLSLAGVIVDHPTIGSTIDREAFGEFLRNPPALVDETFWDDLFAAGDIEGTGRLPAMLLALLLLAPDTVSAVRRGDLRIGALEPPPVAPDASDQWKDLRQNSTGWIPITFPFRRDEEGRLLLEEFPDLGNDIQPDVAMSVLIRSLRRLAGGRTVTDFEMWVVPSVDADRHELKTGSGLVVRLEPGVPTGFGYDGELGTWNAAIRPSDGSAQNQGSLVIGREAEDGQPDLIFGPPYDTRIVVRDLGAELRLRELDEPSVELIGRVDGFGVVLTNRWFRSVGKLGSFLREGLRLDLDLATRLAEGADFELTVEGGLATRIHLDKQLGGDDLHLKVHSVGLFVPIRASQDHFDTRAEVRAHWSATIGPVTLVMDGAGGWVGWWADEPGGDKECIGLLAPTGVGLQLKLPGVTAGGFLDFTGGPNDRYGGVVSVALTAKDIAPPFSVVGFGVHELTGNPNALDRRRSFIVVLGATFNPGIPLFWGAELFGVGGIVGLHRRADTDALRERLTSGAVGNILFADDPIRNAPVLLGDLAAIFPPALDVNVYGITLKVGWIRLQKGYFVQLAIGVVLEFPRPHGVPSKIIVLGSARAGLPEFRAVLEIEIDVIGIADIVNRTFELDATIRKGRLLKIFTLSGDAAVRASWGDRPFLMATLGGFHPDFHPEPAVFPKLARLRLAVDKDALPKALSVTGTAYVAVTTNTIQFGSELEVVISSGSWNIEGRVGGDALVRLPFFFDVEIHGRVAVRYKRVTLAAVRLSGGLSGPRPTVLRGEVCIEVLFLDACYSDSWQLGSSPVPAGEVVESLVPIVAAELALTANLRKLGDSDNHVLLEPRDSGGRTAFEPVGRLVWEQNRVPLALRVQKIEGNRLAGAQRVTVASSLPSVPVKDWFGTGQFVELTESEALALPSFERHQSGVEVLLEQTHADPETATVEIEEIRIPERPQRGIVVQLPEWAVAGVAAREDSNPIRGGQPRFEVADEAFIADTATAPGAVSEVDAYVATTIASSGEAAGATAHPADRLVELVV